MAAYSWLKGFLHTFRLPLIVLFNAGVTIASYLVALGLRFEFDPDDALIPSYITTPLTILITARLFCYLKWDLNRGYWRYVSTPDLTRLIKAHLTSSLIFAAGVLLFGVRGFPRSIFFIELALSILFAGGARFMVRLFGERLLEIYEEGGSSRRGVLVLGAGDSGHLLVKNLVSNPRLGYHVFGVLDDSERLRGTSVHGAPVLGPILDLEIHLMRTQAVSAVIVAIPSLSEARWNEIKTACNRRNVLVKRLQAFEDLACLDSAVQQEELSIETLLEKEVTIEHEEEIREAIRSRCILITGAGGSIGSELVRQLLPFGPERVVLLDHSEFNLFQINREIAAKFPHSKKEAVIASVCDADRLKAIFERFRPEIVFHAAAYKHVPLMEENCYEAFKNNVVGTRNVIEAAHTHGARRFVLVSTDKAVDPSSIMGCSKRIGELIVQEYASDNRRSGLSTAIVRFGNVINSAGSVVPLFREQILTGGPVTVTHPEMERFFMSIREAVRLTLTAGTLGESGEVYVLDMGKPVRVVDVAEKMLALYARRDIPIVFSGVRPGEKLKETLVQSEERTSPTRFTKVARAQHKPGTTRGIGAALDKAAEAFTSMNESEIGTMLRQLAGFGRSGTTTIIELPQGGRLPVR